MSSRCASKGPKKPDKLTQELLSTPKETLFEKGKALLARKKYDLGRKYLNFVFETYPNDTQGRESLLLVADSYFRQGGSSSYTEARFRYRDYLNRYPGAPQRDYARYQFALCYDKEHEKPDPDQTSTREAISQYFFLNETATTEIYTSQARERIRRLTDVLEHEFLVGFFICKGLERPWFTIVEERFSSMRGAKAFFTRPRFSEARPPKGGTLPGPPDCGFPGSEYAKKARERPAQALRLRLR